VAQVPKSESASAADCWSAHAEAGAIHGSRRTGGDRSGWDVGAEIFARCFVGIRSRRGAPGRVGSAEPSIRRGNLAAVHRCSGAQSVLSGLRRLG